MTHINYTGPLSARAPFGVVRAYAEQAVNTYRTARARRAAYRATYHQLNGLSNRALADIGMHRSHIRARALEAANKEISHAF